MEGKAQQMLCNTCNKLLIILKIDQSQLKPENTVRSFAGIFTYDKHPFLMRKKILSQFLSV